MRKFIFIGLIHLLLLTKGWPADILLITDAELSGTVGDVIWLMGQSAYDLVWYEDEWGNRYSQLEYRGMPGIYRYENGIYDFLNTPKTYMGEGPNGAGFRFDAPGRYVIEGGYAWCSWINVAGPPPTNNLDASAQAYIGQTFSVTHTANNPTSYSGYFTGFRIHEQREDSNGGIYQPFVEINRVDPTSGNRSFTTTRPAPDRPGLIRYHLRSWNQWMGEWENLKEVIVTVPNRSPTVTISATPSTIAFGQSAQISATLSDPDGNLYALGIMRYDGAAYYRPNMVTYPRLGWNGYAPEGNWSSPSFSDDTASGSSTTKTVTYRPPATGSYTFHANGNDSIAWSNGGYTSLTVNRATPDTHYGDQFGSEGIPLEPTQLNATFFNPHDQSMIAPGIPTYVIISGGVAPFTDGTALYAQQTLPASIYKVRVAIPATANYNARSKDIWFTISANGQADNDGDSINNATEILLGLNPNIPFVNDPAALLLNIFTPRP